MPTTTFSSRDFNREPRRIKCAAADGPHEERILRLSLLDVLMPDDNQDFYFEPPKMRIAVRPAKLD